MIPFSYGFQTIFDDSLHFFEIFAKRCFLHKRTSKIRCSFPVFQIIVFSFVSGLRYALINDGWIKTALDKEHKEIWMLMRFRIFSMKFVIPKEMMKIFFSSE